MKKDIIVLVLFFGCKPNTLKPTLTEIFRIYQSDISTAIKDSSTSLAGAYLNALEKDSKEYLSDTAFLKVNHFLSKRDSIMRLPNIISRYKSETLGGCMMTIYEENGKLYLKTVFTNRGEKPMVQELVQSVEGVRKRKRYNYIGNAMRGEHFIVEDDGNLGEYNKQGRRFGIAKRF